ncbi:condensation domain-containing protein [Micromonospora sp. R77]|uniref:condensation domain-containing protein n=1 Tax=Micromonospora sp. R77 TaxID=2925836 RepID=UPI001F60D4AF|nr:condensation domain-containing protein [Micromonospora sp. R77]MCI4066801.1 condensation domain-containing protein [Micromonospora sp. R77]
MAQLGNDSSDLVELLARTWRDVLRRDDIDEGANFFELGGDSLQLVRVVTMARAAGVRIPPAVFRRHPTIRELARALAEGTPAGPARPVPVSGPIPLLPSQVRFFDWRIEDPDAYSTTLVARVSASVDPVLLGRALYALAERHEALRTVFPTGPQGRHVVLQDASAATRYKMVSAHGLAEDAVDKLVADVVDGLRAAIDISAGPLWHATHLDHGELGGTLCLVVHHLVADAPSLGVLVEDLQELYGTLQVGGAGPTPGEPVVANHARKFRELAAGRVDEETVAYWAGRPWHRFGRLPRSTTATAADLSRAVTLHRTLPGPVTDSLVRSLAATGTSTEEALVSALATTLREVTGSDVVALTVTRNGREPVGDDYDLSREVGYLVLSAPCLLEFPDSPAQPAPLAEQIQRQRDLAREWNALRHLGDDRARWADLPAPEVHLVYLGVRADRWQPPFEALWSRQNEPRVGELPHPVSVYAEIVDGELCLSWIYGTDLLAEQTVRELADGTQRRLTGQGADAPSGPARTDRDARTVSS